MREYIGRHLSNRHVHSSRNVMLFKNNISSPKSVNHSSKVG